MMTIDLSAFSHTDPNDAATLAAMAEPAQTTQEYPNDMEVASPADALLVENTTQPNRAARYIFGGFAACTTLEAWLAVNDATFEI